MASSDSKATSIQTHFKTLASVAPTLNAASNELTQAVVVLEEALKKLNIGLSAWVTFRSRGEENWQYDDDQLGYAKVDGKWGIAIRRIWGDERVDNYGGDGPWMFNDAPRELRVLAVDSLPKLIEQLGKEATSTTEKVQQKAKQVRELASAVSEIEPELKATQFIGVSAHQVQAIINMTSEQHKFVAELLEHAAVWERKSDDLWICYTANKNTFAGLLEGPSTLKKVSEVAQKVLGAPVKIAAKVLAPKSDKGTK